MRDETGGKEKPFHPFTNSLGFWSINLGLAAMVLLSMLPVGLMQAWASVEFGTWQVRSAEFFQTPLLTRLRTHLEKPTRFTAAKPPYYRKKSTAISQFRDTAHEHIARIREMVAILESHGASVQMLKTDRVGYVVYEDEHQVVAEPFSDVKL